MTKYEGVWSNNLDTTNENLCNFVRKTKRNLIQNVFWIFRMYSITNLRRVNTNLLVTTSPTHSILIHSTCTTFWKSKTFNSSDLQNGLSTIRDRGCAHSNSEGHGTQSLRCREAGWPKGGLTRSLEGSSSQWRMWTVSPCTSRSQYPGGNRSAKLGCRVTAINQQETLKLVPC